MQRTRIFLITLFLFGMILSTTAFANVAPPMAVALPEGRTHDQAHDTGYIDWSGPVQYTYMAHRDYSELPPEEGGTFCGAGCWEWVTHLGNGGTVSGSFDRDVAYFEVMVASTHDSSVGNATLRACSAVRTTDMYDGPGQGMPGFVSLILNVPAGCRTWSLSASSGYLDFRSVDVIYGAPPPPPTNTWTPPPSFTPTITSTPTMTFTPTATLTSTPSPTPTPLPPGITGQVVCDLWGNAGWCRANEALDIAASDPQGFPVTISGDLNGIPFSCGDSCRLLLPEGTGTANYSVISGSGKTAAGSSTWQRDSTPPVLNVFSPPLDGKNGWYVSEVNVSADASDATSGLFSVAGSIDESVIWNSFPLHISDGVFSVMGRAQDIAGNETTLTKVIRKVSPNYFPIVSVKVKISDPQDRWPEVVMHFDPDKVPESISWDRRFTDGTLAPSGEYRVVAVACDNHDLCGNDAGIIGIPFVASPTVTLPPSPTASATATPTTISTATEWPATSTPILVTPSQQISPKPARPVDPLPFWQVLGLIGLFLAISSASVVDPRPAALDRLKESLQLISSQNKIDSSDQKK